MKNLRMMIVMILHGDKPLDWIVIYGLLWRFRRPRLRNGSMPVQWFL